VFLAEPEAFGVRAYLTAPETRQLLADWQERLARFAERLDEPARRPDGAVPVEFVILGRQIPS
jgi:hypothetical protein